MNWYLVWIIAFLVLLFGVCVWSSKKVHTADGYVMADFSLGFFPICGSMIATVTGSGALIGGAGKGFEMGLSFFITVISMCSFSVVAILVLGPVIRRLRLYTVPELFLQRFGKFSALIPALVIGFLYMTPTFGMQLVGMGSILASITEVPFTWGIILGYVVTFAFTMIGGMPSVAWTDAIQTVVILAGVILTFVLGLIHVGGPAEVVESTPTDLMTFGSIGGMELLNWFLVFGPFYLVWQTTWQRLTAARTQRIGISAIVVGFVISGVIGLVAILIGIMAVQEFPPGTAPDLIYTSFITEIFPGSVGGLFMVSLLAALLTGATSFLLSGAINVSKDIYQTWFDPEAGDLKVLRVSRVSVAAMSALGLGVALWITDIVAIYEVALSFTASALVMPVLAAMFWQRATKTGVIVSMVGALVVSLGWQTAGQPFGVHEIGPGLVTSAVLLVLVSLLTRHSDDETVTAYYHAFRGLPPAADLLAHDEAPVRDRS